MAEKEQDPMSSYDRVFHLVNLGRFGEAKQQAATALASDPTDVQMLSLLAEAQYKTDGPKKAVETMRHCLSLAPHSSYFHGQLGRFLAGGGKHAEAYESFATGLAIAPTSEFILGANIEAIVQDTRFDKKSSRPALSARVTELTQLLLSNYPDSASSHIIAAKVSLLHKRNAQAKAEAERGLAIDPNHPVGHQMLGLAQQGLGQTRAAGDSFVTAAKANPTSSTAPNLLRSLGKGSAAPIGLGAFFLIRIVAKLSSRGAVGAGIPVAIVVGVLLVGGLIFWMTRRSRAGQAASSQLSPQAQAILKQDKRLR